MGRELAGKNILNYNLIKWNKGLLIENNEMQQLYEKLDRAELYWLRSG